MSSLLVVLVPAIVARGLPFVLNALTLSHAAAADLGTAAQVQLLVASALVVFRDPLRLTVGKNKQLAVNLSYVSLFAYHLVVPPLLYFLFGFEPHVLILFLAYILQLVFEPYLLISQYIQLEYGRRSTLESLGSLFKCLVHTFVTLRYEDYVIGFALGELAYTCTILFGYLYFFNGEVLLPKMIEFKENEEFVDPSTLSSYKSSILNQFVKLFLSQGDKFLISTMLPLEMQGYYSLIDNYGSLIPRLVFAPLEESVRINLKNEVSISSIISLYQYLLPLLATFGPLNINFLTRTLLFRHRAIPEEVTTVFPLYMLSLPLLGINGILEAITAVSFEPNTTFMFFSSLVFYLAMVIFSPYGLQGFVCANIINSFIRIIWNYSYVYNMDFRAPIPWSYILTVAGSLLFQLVKFEALSVTSWNQFITSAICGAVCVAHALYLHFFKGAKKLPDETPVHNSKHVKLG